MTDLLKLWIDFQKTFQEPYQDADISILKKIFSPDDATLASQPTGSIEPIDAIASRVRLSADETQERLTKMANCAIMFDEAGRLHLKLGHVSPTLKTLETFLFH